MKRILGIPIDPYARKDMFDFYKMHWRGILMDKVFKPQLFYYGYTDIGGQPHKWGYAGTRVQFDAFLDGVIIGSGEYCWKEMK